MSGRAWWIDGSRHGRSDRFVPWRMPERECAGSGWRRSDRSRLISSFRTRAGSRWQAQRARRRIDRLQNGESRGSRSRRPEWPKRSGSRGWPRVASRDDSIASSQADDCGGVGDCDRPVFAAGLAQYPQARLSSLSRTGVRAGETAEVTLRGTDLEGATQLWFDHPGLSAVHVKDLTFRVTAGPDVPLGRSRPARGRDLRREQSAHFCRGRSTGVDRDRAQQHTREGRCDRDQHRDPR